MTKEPNVTVIIPCYNVERYVDQALTSAEQSTCTLQIIALNDGSTDATLSILKAHERREARVQVVDKPNEGYGATINRGLREAQGTYVAILEPDDWVMPHMYDRLFDFACAQGMPDVVKSSYWRILGTQRGTQLRARGYLFGRVGHHERPFVLVDEPDLIVYHPSVWSALYRRAFLLKNDIWFVEAPGAGWVDNPFTVRAYAMAQSIAYTDEAYYCYREDLLEASSAHIDPIVMVKRWHERQDVLDELHIDDPGIVRANVAVALRFLTRIMASGDLTDHDVLEATQSMARRLDPAMVARADDVSLDVVRCCLALAGVPACDVSSLPYRLHLVREAAWALHTNGARFLFHNIKLASSR